MRLLTRPISLLGRAALDSVAFIGNLGFLLADTVRLSRRALVDKRGRRLGWSNLWAQMVRVGVNSIPIVSLVVFCIGAILALQMAPILRDYGAVSRVADIIAVAMFRELGPLVAAIVLTGFAGASIAAELGTMVVSEEIEALEAHAIDPIRFLVVPRVLATTVMMVCLAVLADVMGVIGGMLVSKVVLGVSLTLYIHHTFDIVEVKDFITGLVKAAVFGAIISSMACALGLRVTGGAQGVGVATTRTVVLTIVALILVDLAFTAVFYFFNL
jgi:phospholipid/cholesterol/gamma-HCH transport system permease protein